MGATQPSCLLLESVVRVRVAHLHETNAHATEGQFFCARSAVRFRMLGQLIFTLLVFLVRIRETKNVD